MIIIDNISKSFSSHAVLQNVSLTLGKQERIALIGKNGAGKTTLLHIINGTLTPDTGRYYSPESIGYVAQDLVEMPSLNNFESWRLHAALSEVGLEPETVNKSVKALSGGERTRLSLAFTLAQDPTPTVLLLDEPTNNLDSQGIRWLERFIASFRGSVVVVSHDRMFINRVATKLWVLDSGKLEEFKGNYNEYKDYVAQKHERLEKEYEIHKKETKKVEKLIREATNRSKQRARDKPSHDNDKFTKNFKNEYVQNSLGKRAKALHTRLEKLGSADAPHKEKQYTIHLAGEVASSKVMVTLEHIKKIYDSKTILTDFSLKVYGTDRVWVRGRNGSGKSTLLKIITRNTFPDEGTVVYGPGIRVGYFSQDVYGLNEEVSGYEALSQLNVGDEQIYRQAKGLGITPELLHRKVSRLSRGQQAKVGFLKLLLGDYELLVLDEPTNHLDISTKEAIEEALREYKGSIVVASHDTYFVDSLRITGEVELGVFLRKITPKG